MQQNLRALEYHVAADWICNNHNCDIWKKKPDFVTVWDLYFTTCDDNNRMSKQLHQFWILQSNRLKPYGLNFRSAEEEAIFSAARLLLTAFTATPVHQIHLHWSFYTVLTELKGVILSVAMHL